MKITVDKPPVERIIVLTMSEDEALSLLILCGGVGGDQYLSRRRHFDDLGQQIESVGIQKPTKVGYTGSIHFPKQ